MSADSGDGMSGDSAFPHLFSRFQLGSVELKNRIVHASMSTRFAKDGRVTDKLIDYHVSRIRGGAAMTVTEVLGVLAHQKDPFRVQVYSDENADGLPAGHLQFAPPTATYLASCRTVDAAATSQVVTTPQSELPDCLTI